MRTYIKDFPFFAIILLFGLLCFCLGRYGQVWYSVTDLQCANVSDLREELRQMRENAITHGEGDLGSSLPHENVPAGENGRVPKSFSKFRILFELKTHEDQDYSYVNKQAKGFKSLVVSMPSVRTVSVLRIEGVDGEGKGYPIDLD
jgi:hypothetical protein